MKTKQIRSSFYLVGLALGLLLLTVTFYCTSERSLGNSNDLFTWTFSGSVVDGSSNRFLNRVHISYIDDQGESVNIVNDSANGSFRILKLPAGQRNFLFAKDSTDTAGLRYTQRIVSLVSGGQTPDSVTIPWDISATVKLFPCTGTLVGMVKSRLYPGGFAIAAPLIIVKVRYGSSAMQNAYPATFQTVTDSGGAFRFTNLPVADSVVVEAVNSSLGGIAYKATAFAQPALVPALAVSLGTVYMEPVDLQNSRFTFVYSNVYDPHSGVPKNGLVVNGTIVITANKKISSAQSVLKKVDTIVSITTTVKNDSIFITPQDRLQAGTLYTLYATASAESGETGTVNEKIGYIQFLTGQGLVRIVSSNVLSRDGWGLNNVPVTVVPYFVVSTLLKTGSVRVDFTGGGSPKAVVRVARDTIFAHPVVSFDNNAPIKTVIHGEDTAGNGFDFILEGQYAFTTEDVMFAVASNTWDAGGKPLDNFASYDTMWVRYSEQLDTGTASIEWFDPDAPIKIYGATANANALVWVHADTVFVLPDIRLHLNYGDTTAFKILVQSSGGKKSASKEFSVIVEKKDVFVRWTNTQDSLGRTREDFGTDEKVIIVANSPIGKIDSVSAIAGVEPPPDLSPDNFTVSNDTIFYKSGITMNANTRYGMDFDVTFSHGLKKKDVLAVQWKTQTPVTIVAVNNRISGKYRMLRTIGDSVMLTFSKPIDTAALAPTPFRVHIVDKNDREYRARITWDTTRTKSTLILQDTLNTADVDADPAYTVNAVNTRAITNITVDLTSQNGEQIKKLGLSQGTIELHSEPGLCVTGSNIVHNHIPSKPVTKEELASDNVSTDSLVYLIFNRALDTATMKKNGAERYFSIRDTNKNSYAVSLLFSSDARIAYLRPESCLPSNQRYFLCCKNIPGYGIGNAGAINKHAGSFSGAADSSALLKNPFSVLQSIKILSIDNKNGAKYRIFRVFGDSLTVTFSKPIDTTALAAVRFRAHIIDKTGREYATSPRWKQGLTTVTLTIADTLKTADEDADPAYIPNAPNTRAITDVTFDLTTTNGEMAKNIGSLTGPAELHTEKGLCVVNASILRNHVPGTPVAITEKTVTDLKVNDSIVLSFNRPIDTAEILRKGAELFFAIVDSLMISCAYSISFSADARTLCLKPQASTKPDIPYYLQVSNVPGENIAGAGAINKHAGCFTGAAENRSLVSAPFRMQQNIKILSVNNKIGSRYRAFKVIHDTFTVVFSTAIDTSSLAPTKFRVIMTDTTNKEYSTFTIWDQTQTQALLVILDTLRTANINVDPLVAYSSHSPYTRAISSVLFNLTTTGGEQVKNLGMNAGPIELHSEPGICAISSNIVKNHPEGTPIGRFELPVWNFDPDGAISVGFNRALDTETINWVGINNYISILTSNLQPIAARGSFSADAKTVFLKPTYKFKPEVEYYVKMEKIPGAGIKGALPINLHGGSASGDGFSNELLYYAFRIQSPAITSLAGSLLPDTNTMSGVAGNRIGVSPEITNYTSAMGAINVFDLSPYYYPMRLRIKEAAWNPNHNDSVSGYQIQVQKIDRSGIAGGWFPVVVTAKTIPYSPSGTGISTQTIEMRYEDFITSLITPDNDGNSSYFYENGNSFFNDSCTFQIRIRPYVGSGNPQNFEVGQWSDALEYIDNIAPCDSDFVTAQYCNDIYSGGTRTYEYVTWKNSGTTIVQTGYISVEFSEDMDITGPAPRISIYYGTFGGNPPVDSIVTGLGSSGWSSARSYRCFVGVPVGDYTHGNDSTGVFYNVNVAGCKDASGLAIQAYGTDGVKAKKHPGDADRVNWKDANDQMQGSRSVIKGFGLGQEEEKKGK
jgi:hypothetical protein